MKAQNERAATGISGDGPLEIARLSKISNHESNSNVVRLQSDKRSSSLRAQHREWGLPSEKETWWLICQGLDEKSLCSPWPLGGATVRFLGNGKFEADPDGERALIFRAEDRGEVTDLIAWQPRLNKIASWRGTAFAVGDLDQIFNPATYFDGSALLIHRTPLEWLRANPS